MIKEILLIEDEKSLYEIIQMNLELEGFKVKVVSDGKDALTYSEKLNHFSLVILDIMLPHVNGLDICREYRKHSQIPILFLSAKGTTTDRIMGLKLGANDYLPKPFDLEELLLRVSVLTGMSNSTKSEEQLKIGTKKVDFKTFEISENDEIIGQLSKREVDLLKLFSSKAGEVVSRDLILDEVWGVEQFSTSRTIDNYILNFRKLFEEDVKNPHYFHSIRGVGYKFTP
jgi:two-component system alkaline phosphatase synthesis response regulator PhoP